MADPRMEKWAAALCGYSVEVQSGQTVAIMGGAAAEPLLRAIYREVLTRDAFPVLVPSFSGISADLMGRGSDEQLVYISPIERFAREQADVAIQVLADTNTKSMANVDPTRQVVYQRARTELFNTFMKRDAEGSLQWTLTLYPTDAYAQDADMSTEDFTSFVLNGCKLNEDDPIGAWKQLASEQQRLVDWLSTKQELHLTGPDTDLKLSTAGRTWVNADGRKNFPDGEIFTGPVEDSINGHIRFSYPVVNAGREISDIRLRFENGKVVDATASKGEDYLHEQLNVDEGARYLGEFAFGSNFDIDRFTRNILFDEKIGGTVHMAIGSAYPETGSANVSAVHWDMICDLREGGKVSADGEPFLVDGKFVV